jgi:tellurium resistance protein TerD
MSISLKKGEKADLTKGTGVQKIKVALGWRPKKFDTEQDFDLDASVLCLNKDGKANDSKDLVYYNNLKHPSGAIVHSGDDRTGGDQGDNEIITIDLPKVPANIERMACIITIYESEARKQNFGMIESARARVIDAATNKEIAIYDLTEGYSLETAMIIGEIYRHDGEWKFGAIGAGFAGGLGALASKYGL